MQVRTFDESGKVIKLFADIIVTKDSQRSMVVGGGAKLIKRIGTEARKDLEGILGEKVYLELFVKAKKNWFKEEQFMKEVGYVTDNS